jgi:HNH endonuclease
MLPLYRRCFTRDEWKCRHCLSRSNLHPHHVIYRSQGGQDVLNNLITLCAQCHLIGIHEKKLTLEVVQVLDNDVIVKFTREKGWKPT